MHALRRAPLPLCLLVPRRGVAPGRDRGRGRASRATRRSRSPTTTGCTARWSSRTACKPLGVRPITGAELTLDDGSHLTLLCEDGTGYRNLCLLLTLAHAGTRDVERIGHGAAGASARASGSRTWSATPTGSCACRAARARARWRGRVERGEHAAAAAVGAAAAARLRARALPDRAAAPVRPPRPAAATALLAQLAERLGVPCVATGNVHAHDALAGAAPGRVRGGAARHHARRVGAAAARQLLARARAAGGDGRALRRPPGGGRGVGPARRAARASTSRATSATATPARRTRAPTAGSPSSAARGSATATAGAPACAEAERAARAGARRSSARSGCRASSCSTATCSSSRARWRPRCAAPSAARAVLPPGRGRGSSVSSIVCYLTGLSHIDPIENDLFLGRFLNEELSALPDIDLDFPRDIREVLIPRVHERYGHDRSALVAAFATYHVALGDPRLRQGARASRPARSSARRASAEPWGDDDVERPRGARRSARARRLAALARARPARARRAEPAAPRDPAPGRDGHLHPAAGRDLPDPARGDGAAARWCSGTRSRAPTPAS